jgi:hypothetical protein
MPVVPFCIAKNVFLDPASGHQWNDLIQRDFLADLFNILISQLPPELEDVFFYVFSPLKATQRPASVDFTQQRKVLIFLSDECDEVTPNNLASHYLAIFKPSMRREKVGANIFTMSLGIANGVPATFPKPIDERSVDLLFTGNLNRNRYPLYFAFHPVLRHVSGLARSWWFHLFVRSPANHLLRRDFSSSAPSPRLVTFTAGFGQGLSRADYGAMLADSRIVLAPRGFVSAETFRHLEALRAGAVVVSDRLPDTFLYRDAPIQCVDDWSEGLRLVNELLGDPARLQLLQDAGLRWYQDVLSPRATALRMIDTVLNAGA